MRFRPPDSPTGNEDNNDDPFAEFPLEPTARPDAPKEHDWLAEFPDEHTAADLRSKTWSRLSESVKNENERS